MARGLVRLCLRGDRQASLAMLPPMSEWLHAKGARVPVTWTKESRIEGIWAVSRLGTTLRRNKRGRLTSQFFVAATTACSNDRRSALGSGKN